MVRVGNDSCEIGSLTEFDPSRPVLDKSKPFYFDLKSDEISI